jgi:hypothetical protein
MNWNPFKKKDEGPEFDPLKDLTLSGLKPGYVLDYDLKTWQVTAQHRYEYDGDPTDEWELTCADDVVYLEREEDDGVTWTLTRKVGANAIEENLRSHMKDNDDPPETLTFQGTEYEADSSDVGQFFKDGEGEGQEFISWSYVDESEKKVLFVEQWGDNDYDVAAGEVVEEFQFSDILPGGKS